MVHSHRVCSDGSQPSCLFKWFIAIVSDQIAFKQLHTAPCWLSHLGLHVRQLAGLLRRLAEEVGAHFQHGRRLCVHLVPLLLHTGAHILPDEALQLPGNTGNTNILFTNSL